MAMATTADSRWWIFTLPAVLGADALGGCGCLVLAAVIFAAVAGALTAWAVSRGGPAWAHGRSSVGPTAIPGPRGLPVFGSIFALSRGLPHRTLAAMAKACGASKLMAVSVGVTPAVVAFDPSTARELLTSVSFADRPVKRSARELMFTRAIGFAPNGAYWRLLRRISSTHLFAPRRIAAHEAGRRADCQAMLAGIKSDMSKNGAVSLRRHLQGAALNNIMGSVFGKRYDVGKHTAEAEILKDMVREGFELLGAFNWSDHLPWLAHFYDPSNVVNRSAMLVPRVKAFVSAIIDDHRNAKGAEDGAADGADFVDVLLSLQGDEALEDDDMVAVLWEMIFRGTDTTALLTEWAMAELVLHPEVQSKLRAEIEAVTGGNVATDADVARMPYLQAVIKETLRSHPPGPLLSWARLATEDVQFSNGMVVPAGTTAMVNMWAITHDPAVWADPEAFKPERFIPAEGGADVDVRGGDLRLAPFGAGRRVCPGKNLGLVTVGLWVARLVQSFKWAPAAGEPVVLDEVLKLSLEMKKPLVAVAAVV